MFAGVHGFVAQRNKWVIVTKKMCLALARKWDSRLDQLKPHQLQNWWLAFRPVGSQACSSRGCEDTVARRWLLYKGVGVPPTKQNYTPPHPPHTPSP